MVHPPPRLRRTLTSVPWLEQAPQASLLPLGCWVLAGPVLCGVGAEVQCVGLQVLELSALLQIQNLHVFSNGT